MRIISPLFSGLDDAEHALVPRLDGDASGIGSGYGRYVVDGHHASVRVYADTVEQADVGLACADMRQRFVQIHDCHIHFFFSFADNCF